jgi:hypothetical protein
MAGYAATETKEVEKWLGRNGGARAAKPLLVDEYMDYT